MKQDRQPIHYQSLVVELSPHEYGDALHHREFVVMHGDYVYPEYVVAYHRTATTTTQQVRLDLEPEPEPEPGLEIAEGVPPTC